MTGVTYSVLVDDADVADGLKGFAYRLREGQIPNGPHAIAVSATDPLLQTTDSSTSELLIDRRAPRVSINSRRGYTTVQVRVNDGPKGQVSGIPGGATTVNWGDGHRSFGRLLLKHTYKHGGVFRVKVSTVDGAGNHKRVTRKVSV
jgi:hypothetical protein